MKTTEQILEEYGRFLLLRDAVPGWEAQCREGRAALREKKLDMDWKEVDMKNLENPNFFQRLLGRIEEKQEKARTAYREAAAEYTREKRHLEGLEQKLTEMKQELSALEGAEEAWRSRQGEDISKELVRQYIAPAALQAANLILEALEQAGEWMRVDARRRDVQQGNRKLEFLGLASGYALRLVDYLALMGMDPGQQGGYLRYPDSYITGVTSEYKQLDRLNGAMDQVRQVRSNLKEV